MRRGFKIKEQYAGKEADQPIMQGEPASKQHGQAARFPVHEDTSMFKIAKGYDTVSKTIRIPEPMAQHLEHLACENNISLNQLINQCIAFALSHMYPEKECQEES